MSTPPWFIPSRLKPRQLLLVVVLADAGNLHRAAELLNMTQPTASKLLKELEDALQVPLFERLPRGVRPTWYGEAMVRHARAALGSLGAAHEEIQALKDGRQGQVAVGAVSAPGVTLLPPAVARIKRERPGMRISLEIESSDVLLDRLDAGHLDLVVARLFAQHDKSRLRYRRLAGEPVCAVSRRGHPLLAQSGLTLAGLMEYGWIVPPPGSVLRHRFDLMCQAHGLQPPADLVETAALLFITRMLEQSDRLAVLALDVARYYAGQQAVEILPLELPCHMDDFGIIVRTDRPLSPAAQAMMRALEDEARALYG